MSREIYVSTDVETNGPIPGIYSMLSFGSAAYTADKKLIATFEANLETLPDAAENGDTMLAGGRLSPTPGLNAVRICKPQRR